VENDGWVNNRDRVDALHAAGSTLPEESRRQWLQLVEEARSAESGHDRSDETAYLLRSDANAARLREALERARRGDVEHHGLIDEA
jgi:uncharacterized membrane protein